MLEDTAVQNKVYDVNKYVEEGLHPGGNASIAMNAGTDATEDFEAVHSAKAWRQPEPFLIGYLDPKENHNTDGSENVIAPPMPASAVRSGQRPRGISFNTQIDHPEMYGKNLVGEAAESCSVRQNVVGSTAHDAGDGSNRSESQEVDSACL